MNIPEWSPDQREDEFPVTRAWAFFNHAAVAPLCRRARDRIVAWCDDMAANGDVGGPPWWRMVEGVRRQAADLLHADATEIALLKNTSEGLALVAEGFPWQTGDNVVIVEGEYPANVYPWMHLRDRGVETRVVPLRDGAVNLDDIAARFDARTRLLSLSFVQFATGYRSDLAAAGELCRSSGVDFCVDAIQGLGVFDVDVSRMPIDYLAADGHKWLLGPEGAAIFYVRKEKLDKLRPTSVGWKNVVHMFDYSTIDFRLRGDAGRFEEGTFPIPGLVGLSGSLELFAEVGQPTIEKRIRENTDRMVAGIASAGGVVRSRRDDACWSGIVSFMFPDTEPTDFVRKLREDGIVISSRGGWLRASPHFYNTFDEIDRFVDRLRSR